MTVALVAILLSLRSIGAAEIDRCEADLVKAADVYPGPTPSEPIPASIRQILIDMKNAATRNSMHPDKVCMSEVAKMPSGTIVFVDPHGIDAIDAGPEVRSIRFVVRESRPELLRIHNPGYGLIEFDRNSISQVYGKLYRIKRFQTRSPFIPGEFVQIGWPGSIKPTKPLRLINLETNESDQVVKEALPWVAKFIRVIGPDAYEIGFPRYEGRPRRFKIAANEVYHLNIGSGKTLRSVLATLDEVRPSFAPDEPIRYRDRAGLMRAGNFVGQRGDEVFIERSGGRFSIVGDEIYRSWGPAPPRSIRVETSDYFINNSPHINLERPRKFLRDVLNAAARLSSAPAFENLAFAHQLETLVAFQERLLPWRQAASTVESTGLDNFSDILCAGAGVCRHGTPLMAAILSEAGLSVRIYIRTAQADEIARRNLEYGGHTWLEVDAPDGRTFVIDPSAGVAKTMDDVSRDAALDPKSSDAVWWSHPDRRLLPILSLE